RDFHVTGVQTCALPILDSWLIWQLTADHRHVTDVSNASRTMMFNVHENRWDDTLLRTLNIPTALLPQVQPSGSHFGVAAAKWLRSEERRVGKERVSWKR